MTKKRTSRVDHAVAEAIAAFPTVTQQEDDDCPRFERIYDDLPAQCISNIDSVIALLQDVIMDSEVTDRGRWGAYLAGDAAREALQRLDRT